MELKKLSLLVAAAMVMPSALAASDAEVAQLKNRVAQLESNAEENNWVERFSINGFASLAAGYTADGEGYAGYDKSKVELSNESLLAIQSSYNINDKMDATLQLVTRGAKDWKVEAEWAFVSYENDMGTTFRAGKLRMPTFMLSDFLEVGYAYAYARPAAEVYGTVPVSAYTGIELLHTFDFDNSSLTVQPVYGDIKIGKDDSSLGVESTLEDAVGAALTYEWDRITLRSSYFAANSDSEVEMLNNQGTNFLGLGFRYEADRFTLMSEYTSIEMDGAYPDTDSYYVALSYPIGSVTPYIMYANVESQDNGEREIPVPGIVSAMDIERTAYSIGARWDFIANAALKFDATFADDFGDTSGALSGNFGYVDGIPTPINTGEFDDALVYTVKLDVVF